MHDRARQTNGAWSDISTGSAPVARPRLVLRRGAAPDRGNGATRRRTMACVLHLCALPLLAQDSTAGAARLAWFTTGDLARIGVLAVGVAAIAPFDARWTSGLQQPRFQDNRSLARSADVVRTLGDPGALLIAGSIFAIGRLSRHPALADAGGHASQAIVVSGLVTLGLKTVFGRARPVASAAEVEADEFHFGRGYRAAYASFPSGHTTVAFAAAAAFSSEIARSHHSAARVVTPLLYGAATAVGMSRLYHDQHWATDALVGAAIGTFIGRRLVRRAHEIRESGRREARR